MIPLYRGELHKVSGVPRQWTVPKSQISISVFRNALRKRNAALSRLRQSSACENMDANGTVVANGTGEPSGLASREGSGELDSRGVPDSDAEKESEETAENGVMSDGKLLEMKGQTEPALDESERRQERKRKREEDYRDDTGQFIDGKDEPSRRDIGALDENLRGKLKAVTGGSESMVVDNMDQPVAMDCDVKSLENKVIEHDEPMTELVRVAVSDIGTSSDIECKKGNELGLRDAGNTKQKDLGIAQENAELQLLEVPGTAISNFEETKSAQLVSSTLEENGRDSPGAMDARVTDKVAKKRDELEAKLEKLRAEKHRFVLRLKQVLNEEEMKKRASLASGSPPSLQVPVVVSNDPTVISTRGEKHGVGGSLTSADLEDGELEYARTPSPPIRATSSNHGSLSSHGSQGLPPPLVPVSGRQTSLSQHLSQSASGRGGYYVPGLGISPSPAAPGIAGGAHSPGTGFVGNLPSPLGSLTYSHNLALQQAAAVQSQKVTSVSHGHGQFSPLPPSGGPVGAVQGVAGGPPGFSCYAVSPSVHSHHSHLSQSTSSSLPHVSGQQGINSSSLLTTPRGPPGYHDVRLGGGAWIQR